jgi:hypothetical protein
MDNAARIGAGQALRTAHSETVDTILASGDEETRCLRVHLSP